MSCGGSSLRQCARCWTIRVARRRVGSVLSTSSCSASACVQVHACTSARCVAFAVCCLVASRESNSFWYTRRSSLITSSNRASWSRCAACDAARAPRLGKRQVSNMSLGIPCTSMTDRELAGAWPTCSMPMSHVPCPMSRVKVPHVHVQVHVLPCPMSHVPCPMPHVHAHAHAHAHVMCVNVHSC